jgi:hypothetical protein
MSIETSGPSAPSIVQRVTNIIMKPAAEWDRIDAESGSIKGIYFSYVFILAAIGPVAYLIGSQVFGYGAFGFSWKPPIVTAVMTAVLEYIAQLAGVFITALILDALAPSFGGQKDQFKGFKVAAYSMTAAWLAGVFQIIPMLGWLGIVGLYSCYLFWLGAPKLMRVPQDKAIGYVIVVIIVAIVVNAVIMGVVSSVSMMGMGAARYGGVASIAGPGSITVHNGNGTASVNLGQLAAAANAASAQMKAAQSGQGGAAVQPIASADLQAMLPGSINGFTRGDVSSSSGSAGGIGGAEAQATYSNGTANFTLKVTDMAGAGAIAAMAGALNVNSSEQHGTEYKKVNTVNGRMVTEEYNTANKSGDYAVVAGRFAVDASGNGVDVNDLKTAVNTISFDQLAAKAPH